MAEFRHTTGEPTMNAIDLGKSYDRIASWWDERMMGSDYGLASVRRAICLTANKSTALDIGCGSDGRIARVALSSGFRVTALDVSEQMIALARKRLPDVEFVNTDFGGWEPGRAFDLVVAWDSLFHAPKALQDALTRKMCRLLNPAGVLLFTAGGEDGEREGEMNGVPFGYASLHYSMYLDIIANMGCRVVLMERDQEPLDHMVFMCRAPSSAAV
jgi:SAM-dependent methyltransferase